MSDKKYLKPSQALAAALASVVAGSASASGVTKVDPVRVDQLKAAVTSDSAFAKTPFTLARQDVVNSGETLAYHYSHSSHQSHGSHTSHVSHQSSSY